MSSYTRKMSTRTHPVHLSDEARVLKEIRLDRGLTMREAGELLGKSDSYISQIENGRMKVPEGEALKQLLEIYGGPAPESFRVRVASYRKKFTEKDEIVELLQKTNPLETSIVLKIMKAIMA